MTPPHPAHPAGPPADPLVAEPVVAEPDVAGPEVAEPLSDDSGHLPVAGPDRGWRRFDRLVIAAFVVGLTIPAVAFLVGLRPAAIENRPLFTPPPITAAGLGEPAWYASLDHYVADNIFFRPLAVRLRGELLVRLGSTSNPAVVRGVDDWLFTREELVVTCDYTPDEMAGQLDRISAAFDAAGQDFRFLVAPDKHAIYPDKLRQDDGIDPPCSDEQRPAMQAVLDARPAFAVNGWAAVSAARADAPDGPSLYYKQDSHWTPTGAVAAIRALALSLDPGLWSDADVVDGGSKLVTMDLARQIGLSRKERTLQPRVRPGVKVVRSTVPIPVETKNSRAVYRFTSTGDRPLLGGRTVIVYDSFFGLNMGRVSSLFEDATWIHVGDLKNHPELVAQTGPFDRVILQRVERGLYSTDIEAVLRPLVRAAGS